MSGAPIKVGPGVLAYFEMRNFKYETIFHIAAKYNSLESLKALLGKPK